MPGLVTLVVMVGLHHPARRARAQMPLELEWTAPAECPQRTNVLQQTQALLAGRSITTSHLRAAGRVEKLPKSYRLRLKIQYAQQESERTFESIRCDDLAGAAAVTLALLVREEQVAASRASGAPSATPSTTVPSEEVPASPPVPSSPSGTASVAPTPVVPPAGEPKAPPEPPRAPGAPGARGALGTPRSPWRVFVTGSVMELDVGILPRPSLAFGAGLGVARGAYELTASGTYGWSVNVPVARFTGLRAEFQRWTGDLTGCRVWALGQWALAPCALVSLEGVWAGGEGNYVISRPEHRMWLDLGLRVVGMLRLSPSIQGTITLGARWPTTRWTFSIDEAGDVHRVPMAAFDAAVGARWNL